MIQFIEHKEIDKTRWDECVKNAKNSLVYAYSWYLDIVSPDWNALIENNYESVFPLTWRKKYSIYYLYQPFFTQQLGIFSRKDITSNLVDDFINSVPKKYKFIDIHINFLNNTLSFKLINKTNLIIDCNLSCETIQSSYSENTRRNIKKAHKNNLILKINNSVDVLINLFRLNKGIDIKHLSNKDYKILKTLMNSLLVRKIAEIQTVVDNLGNTLASVFFIKSEQRDIFFFSALTEQGKATGAMFYLIDEYIKQIASTTKIFDFEGSNDTNLARFYKSFGAIEQNYYHLNINKLPFILKSIKK